MKITLVITIVLVLGIGLSLLTPALSEERLVPQWIKNSVKFWTDGQISDSEFLNAVQFLANEGIIEVNAETNAAPEIYVKQSSYTAWVLLLPKMDIEKN